MFASTMKDGILGQLNVKLLSHNMTVPAVSFSSTRSCSRTTLIQIDWQAQDVAAMYSTSMVDKLTTGCFFEARDTAPDPITSTRPEVLLRSSKSPA